ncbi:MAG: hypothetical protein HYY50_01640 [Candidatus Kerfeldbacteria bacterium]|nr:hypothetical protein [Candidatus Kerfeldbacteria bacterium]
MPKAKPQSTLKPPHPSSLFDTSVLGALNPPGSWAEGLAQPAAKKLRQDAQVLLREVLELSDSSPRHS